VVGRIVAERMGRKFVDLDEEIVKESGMSINVIFEKYGEPRFRDLESEKIKEFSLKEDLVIATGGGALIREENVERLRKRSVLICLTASPREILKRVGRQTHRPLLNVEDKVGEIERRLEERRKIYDLAHISIDTDKGGKEQIAGEVLEAFEEFLKNETD
jgi:shikimate kinase